MNDKHESIGPNIDGQHKRNKHIWFDDGGGSDDCTDDNLFPPRSSLNYEWLLMHSLLGVLLHAFLGIDQLEVASLARASVVL